MIAEVPQRTKFISIRLLLWAGLLVQLLNIVPLWSHESKNASILGRYDSGYALVLILHGIVAIDGII